MVKFRTIKRSVDKRTEIINTVGPFLDAPKGSFKAVMGHVRIFD